MQAAINSLVSADLITVYTVDGKPYLHMNTWERHQRKRANNSKYPAPSVGCQTNDGQMSDNCRQSLSNAPEKRETRNEKRETRNDIIEKRDEGFIDDEDARQIQTEQDRILDAAEDAGFKVSNSVRANLLRLYADYGLDKMLAGFESCVKHGATNLAYLEACVKGTGQKKTGRVLPAQDFEQRSYEHVDEMYKLATSYEVLEGLEYKDAVNKAREEIKKKYGVHAFD